MASPVFAPELFKGKVAFITGGGSGICKGIAHTLLAHHCHVAILGRRPDVISSTAKELSNLVGRPGSCLGIQGDVRNPESLKKAVQDTVKEFGGIDFVVCGAAGNFLSPVELMSENAFRTVMEIDTMGTFNTIKATSSEVLKAKGSFLAISATLHYTGTVLQAHASAAKAAIDALFRVLAVEYGPKGVRANVIAPGPIGETEGMSRLVPEDQIAAVTYNIPLQKYGQIQDIAEASLYLLSPAAKYVTGTVLVVDGAEHHKGSQTRLDMFHEAKTKGKL